MGKYVKSLKGRTFRTLEEKLAYEEEVGREAAELTGFDILMENKEKGLEEMRKLLKNEPSLSRKQLANRLKVSMRTAYRYLRIIREGQKVKLTSVDLAVSEKAYRKAKLIKLMETHPEYSRTQLASELGISRKTIYSYFEELGL